MKTPVIGIPLDSEDSGGYSKFPWYALRENYATAIRNGGGLTIMLPHDEPMAEAYLDRIDGLLIPGGNFDVDPALFGEPDRHETVTVKEGRTSFEMTLTRKALERDMPILGICGGQQLLHVVLGGTLIQHIPDEIADALPHEQPNPRDEASHDVNIVPGTLLHDIIGTDTVTVNSAHHQAVKDAPQDVTINARATDGVIEGIEDQRYTFCLGVQWHPEFEIDPGDIRIFAAFVDAARRYA